MADLYQLHTYATEYKAKAVGLVFPWAEGLPTTPIQMRFNQVKVPVWLLFVKMETFDLRRGISLSGSWSGLLS
jgi:5-methylcytosine-specific restriction endonuclease McrBC regulatory subunit McrC